MRKTITGAACTFAVLAVGWLALQSSVLYAAQLEEVIVTAQHRAQSLQDVPVSVNAISGDKIVDAGITNLYDLQAYVPNLTITPSGLSTDIFIRGIGSGMNQGFEQSVGMYVDGIYYGRAQLSKAPFLDLERVEVLRGPQNILQGKNSIAGAISIVTAKPNADREGSISTTFEDRVGERINEIIVSGPVSETVGLRFAARLREYDGYVKNLTSNTDEPAFDEKTFRLKMNWDISDSSALSMKIEIGEFDRKGSPAEIISDLPSDSGTTLFTGRTEAEILDRTEFPEGSGAIVDVDSHDSVRNNYQDFKRSSNGDYSNNDTFNFTLNYDWTNEKGDGFSFIFGYLDYDYDDLCDCDSTAAPLFKLELGEDYKQYSAELRWLSPQGNVWEHIGGAYLQRTDLHFFDKLIQDSPTVVQLLNAADLEDGGERGDFDPDPTSLQPEEQAGFGDAGNAVANITAPRNFFSKSDIASVFLQSTRSISERLRLTLGARLTYEKKTGERSLDFADLQGNSLPIGEVDTVAAISFAAERHNLKGTREEVQFSPLINLQWDINDDTMSYMTLTRGYKAGGFDARSNASPSPALTPTNPGAVRANRTSLIGTFEYEEEVATSFELGVKMGLLQGAAELNMALFYTRYENLQISIFDGTLGFNVGNAKEAVTAGLELDGRMQITDYLHVGGALALLDFEFTDFENGQCRQGETPTSANGVNCDYTGDTNQYVADYSGTLLTGFVAPITEDLAVGAQLDVVFSGAYNPSSNVDPRVEQSGFYTLNARLGIGSIGKDWEVALVGKNLTDEVVLTYIADTPLAYTIFGATTHTGFPAPPFTLGLQASYRW